MREAWPVATLGELADRGGGAVRTGPFGSQLHRADYVSGSDGVPVVMPKDMSGGYIDYSTVAMISHQKAAELRQHIAAPGDILLARRGEIGRCALIKEDDAGILCGTGCIRISVQGSAVIPTFLHRFLLAPQTASRLEGMAVGATMANLNAGIVRSLAVPVPPTGKQIRIAAILAAYDDLIENNTRRIQILEEMAQAIYREWFVEFRFPGHEDVRIVDSELGPIPEGGQVRPIGDVVRTLGGGTPSKAVPAYWTDGSFTWFTPSDLTKSASMFVERSGARITPLGLSRSSATAFPARSVMMTSRATIGVVSITTVEAATNQGFIICVPNERMREYHLYFWLLSNVELFSALASGATFKEISRSKFRPIALAVAPIDVESRFHDMVSPIGELILNLQRNNANLRDTRDLLLPGLISGEIDVSGLDVGHSEPAA